MVINPLSKEQFLEQLEISENYGSFSKSAAGSFYDWMYAEEDGYVQICAFPTSNEVEDAEQAYEHAQNKEEFIDFCMEYSGLWCYQVYAGVNTLPEKPEYGRGRIDSIDTVNTVTLDIETEREKLTGAPHGHIWWSYRYALAQAKYINDEFGVWPMVVMSENGIHLHYKANFPVTDEMLHGKQHRYSKHITKLAMENEYTDTIHSKTPEDVTVSPDDVSDVPRVMKVPGTLGVKSDSGRLCGIIHKPSKENAGCLEVDDIDEQNIPEFEDSGTPTNTSGGNNNVTVELESDISGIGEQLKKSVKMDIASDELFEAFWNGRTLNYDSRSEAEFAFIKKLLSKGYTETEIQVVMDRSGMSKWNEEHEHYRRTTLENAIAQFDGDVSLNSQNSSLSFRTVE